MGESLPAHIVSFYGDELVAVQHQAGDILVVFGRLCDNLGLDRSGQVQRVQRHEVLREGLITVPVQTEGGVQQMPVSGWTCSRCGLRGSRPGG